MASAYAVGVSLIRRPAGDMYSAAQLREAELMQLLLGTPCTATARPDLLAGDWGVIIIVCENWESPTGWRDTPVDHEFIARALGMEAARACEIVDLDGRRRMVLVRLPGPQPRVLLAMALRLHRAIVGAGVVAQTTYTHRCAGEHPERVVCEGLARLAQAMRFAAPTFALPGPAPEKTLGSALREHTQLVARALAEGKLSSAIAVQYTPQCSPGYTVDVIVYGRSMQHYTVVQIPPLR